MDEIGKTGGEHGNELDAGYANSVLIQAFLPYKNPNARELVTARGAHAHPLQPRRLALRGSSWLRGV